jgi:hypothetical protein
MNIHAASQTAIVLALMASAPGFAAEADATAKTESPAKEKRPTKKARTASPPPAAGAPEKPVVNDGRNPLWNPEPSKASDEPAKGNATAKGQAASSDKSPAKPTPAPAARPKATPAPPNSSKDLDSLRREIAELKAAQEAVLGPPPAPPRSSPTPDVQERLAALEKDRKATEDKLTRLETAVSSGLVERDTVGSSFESLRARLATIKAEIEQVNHAVAPPAPRPNVQQRLDAIENSVAKLTAAAASAPAPSAVAERPQPASPPSPPVALPPTTTSALPPSPPAPGVAPSFKLDGGQDSSLKVGLLLQPQYQAAGDYTRNDTSHNLYLRRTRILLGGTLLGRIDYFVDTDFGNLFMTNNVAGANGAADTAVKNTPGMNIQDAFATFRLWKDMVKLDGGYTLPPLAHNTLQGAATLYSWDYFGYAFIHSGTFPSTSNPIGRDAGFQLRGHLLSGLVEYRAGIYQGARKAQTASDVSARNFFRMAARIQVNLLDPETGYFYQGTYFGKKKILSLGASFDAQDEYRYVAGDVFADLPVGPIGVATGQVNVARWDGGTFLPGLAKQTAVMGEAGFYFAAVKLSPIIRVEVLDGTGTVADEYRLSGGIAYWPYNHNGNIKAFFSRSHRDNNAHAINQINLQGQVFVF